MTAVKDYNVHDLVTFRITRPKNHDLRDRINMKFSYFEGTIEEEPDIILNIGAFTPANDYYFSVDHTYKIGENYFYTRDAEGSARWELEIRGVDHGKTIINFNGKISGINSMFNADFLAQNFLLKMIEYKLFGKGFFFAHGAGVRKNNKTYIFPGRGGAFKSTLCMDFIRKKGFEFMGDDRIILNGKKAYAFPMSLYVFDYMIYHLKTETSWSPFTQLAFLKELQKNPSLSVTVCDSADFDHLIFITRTTGNMVRKNELTALQAIKKLVRNNRMEDYIDIGSLNIRSGPFIRYFLAYSYIYPESDIAKFLQTITEFPASSLQDVRASEMAIPSVYNDDIFEKIYAMVE